MCRTDRWSTTDDFATSFLHLFLFSNSSLGVDELQPCPLFGVVLPPVAKDEINVPIALSAFRDKIPPVLLSKDLIRSLFCLPLLLSPLMVPFKMVFARPGDGETWPYHFSLRFLTVVRSSYGSIDSFLDLVVNLFGGINHH